MCFSFLSFSIHLYFFPIQPLDVSDRRLQCCFTLGAHFGLILGILSFALALAFYIDLDYFVDLVLGLSLSLSFILCCPVQSPFSSYSLHYTLFSSVDTKKDDDLSSSEKDWKGWLGAFPYIFTGCFIVELSRFVIQRQFKHMQSRKGVERERLLQEEEHEIATRRERVKEETKRKYDDKRAYYKKKYDDVENNSSYQPPTQTQPSNSSSSSSSSWWNSSSKTNNSDHHQDSKRTSSEKSLNSTRDQPNKPYNPFEDL